MNVTVLSQSKERALQMADTPAEIIGNSVVLLGSFETAEAQPKTLLANGLLRSDDIAGLSINLVLPDAVAFATDWMNVAIESKRIIAATLPAKPMAEPVRDFVLDLVEQMKSAEVDAFGINTDYHFATANLEAWHRVGHTLVPKAGIWDEITKNPGMLSLTLQSEREDGLPGYVRIKVEPSLQIPNGIYIQVNDHFARQPALDNTGLLAVLEDNWPKALQRADKIISRLKSLAEPET